MPTNTKLSGLAGEHHVCAELARRGWAPSLTRDGLERTDILAVRTDSRTVIEVQVKTTLNATTWMLKKKGTLASRSDHEWYVFVSLGAIPAQPRCWIVPRDHVAAATWIQHMSWLMDPSVPEGKRKTPIEGARVPVEAFERYEDRWDLLDAKNTEAPILLPAWMHTTAQEERVGLPDGHPWITQLPAWG